MLQADGVMKECHDGRANALESRERFDESPPVLSLLDFGVYVSYN